MIMVRIPRIDAKIPKTMLIMLSVERLRGLRDLGSGAIGVVARLGK
jgi:hypothetical protein